MRTFRAPFIRRNWMPRLCWTKMCFRTHGSTGRRANHREPFRNCHHHPTGDIGFPEYGLPWLPYAVQRGQPIFVSTIGGEQYRIGREIHVCCKGKLNAHAEKHWKGQCDTAQSVKAGPEKLEPALNEPYQNQIDRSTR